MFPQSNPPRQIHARRGGKSEEDAVGEIADALLGNYRRWCARVGEAPRPVPQQLPGALSPLEEAKAPGVHEIRHPIFSEALAEATTCGRMVELHERLLRACAAQPPPPPLPAQRRPRLG